MHRPSGRAGAALFAAARLTVRRLLLVSLPALALPTLAPPAQAGLQDEVVQASLLPGWVERDGRRMAALRLDLAPGWKTYWRSPGEAGIPPKFDWSASQNLKSLRIHWPSPVVFHTNGMRTIGYEQQLILPIELVPQDPALPIRLEAAIDLGICEDVCLPASLSLSASLEGKGQPDPLISAALQKRPQSGKSAGLSAISCSAEPISDGLRLTARLALPAQGREEVVAIESSDPGLWISEAETRREGAALHATVDMVPPAAQPFALDRSGLTITVISAKGAVEMRGCPG